MATKNGKMAAANVLLEAGAEVNLQSNDVRKSKFNRLGQMILHLYMYYYDYPTLAEGETDSAHVCCKEWNILYCTATAQVQTRRQYQRLCKLSYY